MTQYAHFLIGISGSGKSTFATELQQLIPSSVIVSTDAIRFKLYKDESIQGEWSDIEAEVIKQMQEAVKNNQVIIYDAANAERRWRMDLLMKLARLDLQWIGWILKTSLATCKQRNQTRQRPVPEGIIERMRKTLKDFRPIEAEGFAVVYSVPYKNGVLDRQKVLKDLSFESIKAHIINRRNFRKAYTFHAYSKLLDFERLMYLISLLIHNPGLGNLKTIAPDTFKEMFPEQTSFSTEIAEISAIIEKKYGSGYAKTEALNADLQWLEINSFLGESEENKNWLGDLQIEPLEVSAIDTHTYSDLDRFSQLMKILRFIIYHPFLSDNSVEGGIQKILIQTLLNEKIINYHCLDDFQKDIENILVPYKIFSQPPYRRGYFIGTGILNSSELKQLLRLLKLQSQSLYFDDPLALETYEALVQRMTWGKFLEFSDDYAVKVIGNRSIVNSETLPFQSLGKSHNLKRLEEAIENGELLRLKRLQGVAIYDRDTEENFQAYPLQIVFHNIAWYVGMEIVGEKYNGLLCFARLDRLAIVQSTNQFRSSNKEESLKKQKKALQKLQKLYQSSPGIFLGNSSDDQKKYLSEKKEVRSQVEITVDLAFTDRIYRFIAEGTQRFDRQQIKMSKTTFKPSHDPKVFTLPIATSKKGKDSKFPNNVQLTLPKWSLDDVDFVNKWILSFAGEVKVLEPLELKEKIIKLAQETVEVYKKQIEHNF